MVVPNILICELLLPILITCPTIFIICSGLLISVKASLCGLIFIPLILLNVALLNKLFPDTFKSDNNVVLLDTNKLFKLLFPKVVKLYK